MDAIGAIVKRDKPIVSIFFESTNNNANLATVLTYYKVSDLNHFVSVVVGYVSSVMYLGGFVKYETVSFCPLHGDLLFYPHSFG